MEKQHHKNRQCTCAFSRYRFLPSTFVVCGIKVLSSAFRAIVPSGSDGGDPRILSDMLKCIAKLITCWDTDTLPSSAANIQRTLGGEGVYIRVNISNENKCGSRKSRKACQGWDTSVHIGATSTSQQVRKDGMDWTYTAAVHCIYKGSTMIIPQHDGNAL